jgi:hypothetical protein
MTKQEAGVLTAMSLAAGKLRDRSKEFSDARSFLAQGKERWMEGLEAVKCGAATVWEKPHQADEEPISRLEPSLRSPSLLDALGCTAPIWGHLQ